MNKINLKLAKAVADKLEIKFDKFNLKQFCYGMNVETEHGSKDKKTQIVKNDNPMIFGKIALAHLNEFPDYYIRLNRMEKQAKKDQKILKENPDKINLNGIRQDKRDVELLWYDSDAYTFGYFDNIFYIESGGIKHKDLKNDMGQFDRDDLKHAGRFWLKNHVISFWNPINANDLKKLIKDVYKKVQIKIENDWYIEYDYNKFKTIGEFTGETIKSKDINSDHTTPPMYKIKKPIKGFGSDKYNKLAVTNHYNSVAQMNYYNKNKYAKINEGISDINGLREKSLKILEKKIGNVFPNGQFTIKFNDEVGQKQITKIILSDKIMGSYHKKGINGHIIKIQTKFHDQIDVLSILAHEITHIGQWYNGSISHDLKIKRQIFQNDKEKSKKITPDTSYRRIHSTLNTEQEATLIAVLELIKRNYIKNAVKEFIYYKKYFIKFDRKTFIKKCAFIGIKNSQFIEFRNEVNSNIDRWFKTRITDIQSHSEFIESWKYLKHILKILNLDWMKYVKIIVNTINEDDINSGKYPFISKLWFKNKINGFGNLENFLLRQ